MCGRKANSRGHASRAAPAPLGPGEVGSCSGSRWGFVDPRGTPMGRRVWNPRRAVAVVVAVVAVLVVAVSAAVAMAVSAAVSVASGREVLPSMQLPLALAGPWFPAEITWLPRFHGESRGGRCQEPARTPRLLPSMGVEQRGCTEPGPISPRASSPASPGTCECHPHLRTPRSGGSGGAGLVALAGLHPWGGHVATSHRPPGPLCRRPGGRPAPRWGVRARREGGDGDTDTGTRTRGHGHGDTDMGLRFSAPLPFGGILRTPRPGGTVAGDARRRSRLTVGYQGEHPQCHPLPPRPCLG